MYQKRPKLVAALLLFLSIVCALVSTYLNSRVMGAAAMGVAAYAPSEGSPEWNARVGLRRWADALVYAGFLLALGALALQGTIILSPVHSGASSEGASSGARPVTREALSEGLREYRKDLVIGRRKTIATYDKSVFTLSGGALGLSLTFIHEIAPNPRPETILLLMVSWFSLVSSLVSTFVSLLTSQYAFDKALRQVDEGTVYQMRAGGSLAIVTTVLNIFSAVAFILGVVLLIVFALRNIGA